MATQAELYRPKSGVDLLQLPILNRIARWRYGRLVLQAPFFIIAVTLVYDGFTGSDRAAENLATVVPWVHYRGIIVLVLLLTGNLFCMGCPFTIPRTLAKRLSRRGRRFPKILRNKWLAILMLFLTFFFYEYLDFWESPLMTAWIIVAYFIASFALEAFFSESAFCKYVCPLGTFNFIYSMTSPTQIGAKNPDICRTCVGRECVNGSYSPETVIRIDQIPTASGEMVEKTVEHGPKGTLGCGTELFVPQIKSNLDCVMCLDCVRACPHDNVALFARVPGRELLQPNSLPKQWDISFLLISITFIGLLNAFGMVDPVVTVMRDISSRLGLTSSGMPDRTVEFITLGMIFVSCGLILPFFLSYDAAWLTRTLTNSRSKYSQRDIVAAFAPAFVPIGLGVWIAHYGYHFLIGALTIVPVFQNFLIGHGISVLGDPSWTLGGLNSGTVGIMQIVALMGGFFWSMMIAQRTALRMFRRDGMLALIPWALILLGIAAFGIWIFGLPMDMRGTVFFA